MCNSRGIICDGDEKLNPAQREIAKITNKEHKSGSLAVQDMINGNINYVIIDAAPAACIAQSINEVN